MLACPVLRMHAERQAVSEGAAGADEGSQQDLPTPVRTCTLPGGQEQQVGAGCHCCAASHVMQAHEPYPQQSLQLFCMVMPWHVYPVQGAVGGLNWLNTDPRILCMPCRFGNLVIDVINTLNAAKIEDGTVAKKAQLDWHDELTREEFRAVLAKIDSGLRALPATAQVEWSIMVSSRI